jgi:DNA (cytosine-5)-methyltransferase 1
MRKNLGLQPRELSLLKACPPCQGFSSLAGGKSTDEARDNLIVQVGRFVRAFMPSSLLLENVPGLARDGRFASLMAYLDRLGYSFGEFRLDAADFGVPQRRVRLVLLAVRGKRNCVPRDIFELLTGELPSRVTAGAALAKLYAVGRREDPMSIHRRLAKRTYARVAALPVGGNRFDLPEEHRLRCHNEIDSVGGRRATASYGRVVLDAPAPTMTTRCTTPACGSFIHPTENRGLTLREAAWFQTFPVDYDFVGTYESMERQIGNALPVKMAYFLGRAAQEVVSRAAAGGMSLGPGVKSSVKAAEAKS